MCDDAIMDDLMSVLSLDTINLSEDDVNDCSDEELFSACKKVFDNALDAPASHAIAALVDNVGPVKLMSLAERINYYRKIELRTAILEVTLHQFVATATSHVDVLFGCRKPSTPIGSWTGAYVVAQEGARFVAALFENDVVDYFGYEATMQDAISQYEALISSGWESMSAEDLTLTTEHQEALVMVPPMQVTATDSQSKQKNETHTETHKLPPSSHVPLELTASTINDVTDTTSRSWFDKVSWCCRCCCW